MNREQYPLVSIVIATFNSSRILRKPLEAIMKQSYPKESMEILIVDGGSTDDTKEIAAEYGCCVIDNPDTDPVSAKFLGIKKANGRYLMIIDHDEVLSNSHSIEERINALIEFPDCKVAELSGYRCPQGYAGLNEYVSEFGDPFSLFYYRFSSGYHYYYNGCKRIATLYSDDEKYSVFCFDKGVTKIIMELVCFGTILDLTYFRNTLDADKKKNDLTHLFYKMVAHGENKVIVSKRDPLDHYSIDSVSTYFPKLKWRIINNVHYPDRSAQGFGGRRKTTGSSQIRKYLFPLYSLSLIFPFLDSLYLSLTRHNRSFMWHPLLCLYVTANIMYQYLRKLFKIPPELKTYDGKTISITSNNNN